MPGCKLDEKNILSGIYQKKMTSNLQAETSWGDTLQYFYKFRDISILGEC